MKFKIIAIKGCKSCTEVLLGLSQDDERQHSIEISAWHKDKHGDDFYQYETIEHGDPKILRRIVADLTHTSALEFANSFDI